jgi:cyanophycin synthetase
VRLVEIRLLDGPNLYRLEPAVKVEVAVGRRRTWYGQRTPGAHARVDLTARVRPSEAPTPVATIAAWVGRLHRLRGIRLVATIHRTSEPGHWIVAFPWHEEGRARATAEAAYALTESGHDPVTTRPATRRTVGRPGRSRTLARALRQIAEGDTRPPSWIRDADRRMPAISISGTNGKTTTTRMIAHILRAAGHRVGATTSDGVYVDEALVEAGDLTGPYGARTVLTRDDVDIAVLETARGGIMLRGVGYESNEAAVLTNVSSDHMDLQGIHTLPELAQVKSVIARITKPDGVVVLNADDDLVAGVARRVRAPVWLFSLRPTGPRIRRILAAGGRAFVLEGSDLVELGAGSRRVLLPAAEVPATLGGLARHNIANALAAAAGARAMGASVRDVAEGLRTFGAGEDARFGRLDLYRKGDTTVIVDFAHNEAGVTAVLAVAEGIAGPRDARAGHRSLVMVAGTAGDRPDDTLRGIGRLAAEHADVVVIKETQAYLRGRTRESVVGELRAGIAAGGMDPRSVSVLPDEPSSVRASLAADGTLTATGLPGVLVVMCHEDRAGVVAALTDLGFAPI